MYNITPDSSFLENYQQGLLPQRNRPGFWYSDTSCRSNLSHFSLSSENRRILKKTDKFSFTVAKLPRHPDKIIFSWVKKLNWNFPASSIKTVFSRHLFTTLYLWRLENELVAYAVCYFSPSISHIAYIFYHPQFSHHDLPLRLVLQVVIDSYNQNLKYCYLGRDHTKPTNFYKRNLPGYEYLKDGNWIKYK